jgi:hypothetical protein
VAEDVTEFAPKKRNARPNKKEGLPKWKQYELALYRASNDTAFDKGTPQTRPTQKGSGKTFYPMALPLVHPLFA